MPELPEVETVRRGLEPHVVGRRIAAVTVREPRLRQPIVVGFAEALRERRIVAAGRRAKYLILHLDSGDRLLVHLGMSGRLMLVDPATPLRKHDHVDLRLVAAAAPDWLLRFNDARRFGAMLLWPAGESQHPLLDHLGPEPFDPGFDGDYLYRRSRGRQLAVKAFLMDGQTVVGAGNIYATEALFRAGLRPDRAAGSVSRQAYLRLAAAVRQVLEAAIVQGGTTLRDFAGADGQAGYFAQQLQVYGRDGEPCRVCGSTIRRVILGQRSSFYCPKCQR